MFHPTIIPSFYQELAELPVAKEEGVFILAGEKSGLDFTALQGVFQQKNLPFWGGFFPRIMGNNEQSAESVLVLLLPLSAMPQMVEMSPQHIIEKQPWHQNPNKETGALLVLVDGLNPNIESFLFRLQSLFPSDLPIMGGGAGSLSLQPGPCLFDQEGIYEGKALLVPLRWKVSLGVRHGWKRLAGPFLATHTERNNLCELNWETAFSQFQGILKEEASIDIKPEAFFEVAKGFPFGIYQEGEEDIVRDPIVCHENGVMTCVGEIPENAMLHVLKGTPENLLEAAREATNDALQSLPVPPQKAIVIDCISRVLFLEENFTKELEAVNGALHQNGVDLTLRGILTLGEISSNRNGALNFYNKTIVTGLFYE